MYMQIDFFKPGDRIIYDGMRGIVMTANHFCLYGEYVVDIDPDVIIGKMLRVKGNELILDHSYIREQKLKQLGI